jgi:hypothetical protein|tara:strand:+ start:1171 stop:1599 length:429 start_codon:yes stop_codon:yes gene_type:complete
MSLVYDFIEISYRKVIFPAERPQHTSHFTSFFLEYDTYISRLENFEFQAVQDKQLLTLTLYQLTHNLFFIHHKKYGDIYFWVSLICDECEYVGSSSKVSKPKSFIRLFPLHNEQLNFLCEFEKIFFVGYVDRSIDQPHEEMY